MVDDDKFKKEDELLLADLPFDELSRYCIPRLGVPKTVKSINQVNRLLKPPQGVLDLLQPGVWDTHKKVRDEFSES